MSGSPNRKRCINNNPVYDMAPPARDPNKSNSRRRVEKAQVAAAGGPLQLPSLPRFHPAMYNSNSNSSSVRTTPSSAGVSPAPAPMSPRTQQRALETHRYMAFYSSVMNQQDFSTLTKPPSPKLAPMPNKPGDVFTPLELEGDSYLSAGSGSAKKTAEAMLREEAARMSPRPTVSS